MIEAIAENSSKLRTAAGRRNALVISLHASDGGQRDGGLRGEQLCHFGGNQEAFGGFTVGRHG